MTSWLTVGQILLYALIAVVLLALVLLSRLLSGVVRYACFTRFKNRSLRIPHAGTFAMMQQVKPGGVAKMLDDLRACAPAGRAGDDFAPVVFGGAARDGRQIIVACSADAVKEVLTDTDRFIKSPEVYGNLGPMLGQGLATSEGDVWFQQRKRLTPMFHLTNLRSYTPLINDEGRMLVDKLAQLADGGRAQIASVPAIFAHTALNVIARAVFGERLDIAGVGRRWSIVTNAMGKYFMTLMAFPHFVVPYLPIDSVQKFLSSCTELDGLFSQVIDDCRADTKQDGGSFDLVAQMALLKDEASGDWAIPKQLIIDECKTFTFAAQDTTSNLLSFAMFFLGQDHKLQRELVAECADVLGTAERDAAVVDCDKLKLHRAVLTECLRLCPPVPSLSRQALTDTTLCGLPIERGTTVVAAMIVPQMSAAHFSEPRKFDPHRWIDGSTKERHPFSFTAFSAGSRSCIGQKLAMNEATVLLSHVIRRFEVTVDNPSEVVVAFRGTAEPLHMKVRFTERK
jgi:cytochrome P450